MNSDYKSALDKIHLEQNKKEEMKQLFRKNNMRRKINFIKPAVAVVACMALFVGISQLGNNQATTNSQSGFSIRVNAQTLTKGDLSIDDTNGFAGAMCGSEENSQVSYSIEFPVTCKGKNIDKITYDIKDAVFQITNPEGNSIVKEGKKTSKLLNVPGSIAGCDDKNTKEEDYTKSQYTSLTVDYDKQKDAQTYIGIAYDSKYLSKEQKAIIAKLDAFNGTLEDEKAVYEQLYKNVEISCTVTYKDKTKETKKIKVTPKIGKISDLDSDGLNSGEKNPKADCKIVYTVYSIK